MKIERAYRYMCLALVLTGLAGCSSPNSVLRTDAAVSSLEFRFADPAAEQQLLKIGLMNTFKLYWQAHRDRDWSLRFSLEDLKQGVSEKFYVAYYERAWPLKTVVVRSVSPGTQTTSINIALTLTNPETAEPAFFEADEVWTLVDGKWRHVVSDPMLTKTKE